MECNNRATVAIHVSRDATAERTQGRNEKISKGSCGFDISGAGNR